MADEHGVRIGFEPINPFQRDSIGFVHTAASAADLLDEAGLPQVGVLVDTFNLWDDEGAVAWLRAHGDRVAGIHVADLAGPDDLDRRLPGTLGPRTRELVEAARSGGWDGTLDVEIFSTPEGFWGLAPGEAARRSYAAVSESPGARGKPRAVSDLAVELLHDRDELVRVVVEADLADGPGSLIPAGERQPDITTELLELPPQIAHAGPDIAFVRPRRRRLRSASRPPTTRSRAATASRRSPRLRRPRQAGSRTPSTPVPGRAWGRRRTRRTSG